MSKPSLSAFPLLDYADKLVEDLRSHVPKAVKQWDEEAIHDARVATRRLKAAMEVLKPVLSGDHRKPFNVVLGKLRRRLGPLRDIDVMLGHLPEVSSGSLEAGGDWIREKLQSRRDELRQAASQKVIPPKMLARLGMWWGVREELAECHQAVDTLLAESLHLQLDAFVERADGVVGNLPVSADDLTAQDPHELRIAGKALRYTLEMAVVEGHHLPTAVTRAFKQMQDALGLWHDYVVLAERVMQLSLDEMLPHHDAELQVVVLDVAKNGVKKSARQLERFAQLWRERGQELSGTIRGTFPLVRSAEVATTMVNQEPAPIVNPPIQNHSSAA
jgi:CHAD domain-containing protein